MSELAPEPSPDPRSTEGTCSLCPEGKQALCVAPGVNMAGPAGSSVLTLKEEGVGSQGAVNTQHPADAAPEFLR